MTHSHLYNQTLEQNLDSVRPDDNLMHENGNLLTNQNTNHSFLCL